MTRTVSCSAPGVDTRLAEASDPAPESPEPSGDEVWVEWLLAIANLPHDDHHTEHDGLIVCDICAARHMLDTYQHPDTPDAQE